MKKMILDKIKSIRVELWSTLFFSIFIFALSFFEATVTDITIPNIIDLSTVPVILALLLVGPLTGILTTVTWTIISAVFVPMPTDSSYLILASSRILLVVCIWYSYDYYRTNPKISYNNAIYLAIFIGTTIKKIYLIFLFYFISGAWPDSTLRSFISYLIQLFIYIAFTYVSIEHMKKVKKEFDYIQEEKKKQKGER